MHLTGDVFYFFLENMKASNLEAAAFVFLLFDGYSFKRARPGQRYHPVFVRSFVRSFVSLFVCSRLVDL